jgi:hypothetical protein
MRREKKLDRKKIKDNGEKAEIYFTGSNLLLFCVASSVCKIDRKLYIISLLKDLFVIQVM